MGRNNRCEWTFLNYISIWNLSGYSFYLGYRSTEKVKVIGDTSIFLFKTFSVALNNCSGDRFWIEACHQRFYVDWPATHDIWPTVSKRWGVTWGENVGWSSDGKRQWSDRIRETGRQEDNISSIGVEIYVMVSRIRMRICCNICQMVLHGDAASTILKGMNIWKRHLNR